MSTAHVCFADVPLSSSTSLSSATSMAREGHRSTFDALLNDDATLQRQCNGSSGRVARERNISPDSNSPVPTTPRYERNMGFFRQLSRRFGLRSSDDLVYSGNNEDDNQSSSTDSCSSHSTAAAAKENACKDGQQQCNTMMTMTMTTMSAVEHISCASSETSSTVDIEEQQQQRPHQQQQLQEIADNGEEAAEEDKPQQPCYHKDRKSFARSSFSRLQRRSTTSIRRAFEAFSLSSRSLSCSGTTPPPLPLPTQLHTSSASSSTNNGTPIKSALKSTSNLELNKKCCSSAASCSTMTSSSLSSASSATKSSKSAKTKPPPQRILRQPVSYTYLKGISGLPTQRVPRNSVCCQYARR